MNNTNGPGGVEYPSSNNENGPAGASKTPKPSIIHEKISEGSMHFKMSTNRDPVAIYLGRDEMALLIAWAVNTGIFDPDQSLSKMDIEGDNRPEVSGLPVFLVNAKNHFGFA